MKKLFAILLVAAMLVCMFAGCGQNNEDPNQPNSGNGNVGQSEGTALIGFCSVSLSESIYVLTQQALEAKFAGKATVQTVSCDNDSSTQIQQIKNFITMGADMIIINPTDIEALVDAIKEAHEAGVKVYINGATSDILSDEYYDCCTVSNEYLCGAYVALIAKNWVESHLDQLNASGDWEVAFLESSLSEETLERSAGERTVLEEYLKDYDGNYVDISGNVVTEADRVPNPAYSKVIAEHYKGVVTEQDQTNGGLNVANILTTNPNTRVFIAYNSLASTQGGQYIVDNYANQLDQFAFFSAGVMGNEADYIVGSVSKTDGVTPSVMRGAVQFGVSAAGGEVADSVANTAYAIMYGTEGVDYFKKNPDGIAAWWSVDEAWGSGTAYVAHFNILSGATVLAFDPIDALTDANTIMYWNSKDGFIPEAQEPGADIPGVDEPGTDVPAGPAAAVQPGEYVYEETTPFGEIPWTVTLNADGSAVVAQPENEGMGCPSWTASWKDNGDGTATTYDCEGDGPQIASFWENNSITWQPLNEGHIVPVKSDDYADHVAKYGIPAGGASADPIPAGEYTFDEETPFGVIPWTVTINEDGSYIFGQPENEGMGSPMWTGDKWVDNGDGTFTTPDAQGDGPQIASFWKNNGITWKYNGDGTVTPVE